MGESSSGKPLSVKWMPLDSQASDALEGNGTNFSVSLSSFPRGGTATVV